MKSKMIMAALAVLFFIAAAPAEAGQRYYDSDRNCENQWIVVDRYRDHCGRTIVVYRRAYTERRSSYSSSSYYGRSYASSRNGYYSNSWRNRSRSYNSRGCNW